MMQSIPVHPEQARILEALVADFNAAQRRLTDAFTITVAAAGITEAIFTGVVHTAQGPAVLFETPAPDAPNGADAA